MKESAFILFNNKDNTLKLSWYKRLFGYLFYSYKRKFIKGKFIIRHDGEDIEIGNFFLE